MVRSSKMRRPSITCDSPRRTSACGAMPVVSWPLKRMPPPARAPSSSGSRLEMALSVELLPAPLLPSRATMCPRGTASDRPRRACTTLL